MVEPAWMPHNINLCRVPTTSMLAPVASQLYPTLYCDALSPDAPYYLVPNQWIYEQFGGLLYFPR